MIEFGSDFHYVESGGGSKNTIHLYFPSANYYADGRQALIHLYQTQDWDRLWVPEYFCYDVIESLKSAGIELRYYADYQGNDDSKTLDSIQRRGHFHPRDAVLRMNYFGMRSYRSSRSLGIAAIIEDHTHDLIGEWAHYSRADWCIASLRKALPIPEGGMLWSPVGHQLPDAPKMSDDNERIASVRWEAMRLKLKYLNGDSVEKAQFRSGFIDTEPFFDTAPVSSLDRNSKEFLCSFDVQDWYQKKKENWQLLSDIHKSGVHLLRPESTGCNPFSLILLFDIPSERDRVRKALIDRDVYPAILWSIPCPTDGDIFLFSRRMLSVHCDARYSREDIIQLKSIIESVL